MDQPELDRPETGNVQTVIRKRRTRRHRQNRLIRRALAGFLFVALGFAGASIALEHLSPSLFRSSLLHNSAPAQQYLGGDAGIRMLLLNQQEAARSAANRPVYPYSVVPGGVEDARELKRVAEHDPVVASHYAGFDYVNARIVRLVLARSAYVSYRIGNRVYWTRHPVKLKKGEKLITDGKITLRARCGNRVEEVPQQATSLTEPSAAKLDEPVHPAIGPAVAAPPVPFQSALLERPGVPGLGPAPPLSLYDPFTNGVWVPFSPPPLPGVCGVGKKKTTTTGGKKKKGDPCGPIGGGEVPEPGTWLLMGSGLGLMYWMSRRRLARA